MKTSLLALNIPDVGKKRHHNSCMFMKFALLYEAPIKIILEELKAGTASAQKGYCFS